MASQWPSRCRWPVPGSSRSKSTSAPPKTPVTACFGPTPDCFEQRRNEAEIAALDRLSPAAAFLGSDAEPLAMNRTLRSIATAVALVALLAAGAFAADAAKFQVHDFSLWIVENAGTMANARN